MPPRTARDWYDPGDAFRTGALIGEIKLPLDPDITNIGRRRNGDIPDIVGITITKTDPGGIAIDDILFQLGANTG